MYNLIIIHRIYKLYTYIHLKSITFKGTITDIYTNIMT